MNIIKINHWRIMFKVDGNLHNEKGPAIIDNWGNVKWCVNGLAHRLDGPALIDSRGNAKWFDDGLAHRLDGPSVESNGHPLSWHINGKELTREEYNNKVSNNLLSRSHS
jgi:hypothetical protein